MAINVKVVLQGFSERDAEKLERIFQTTGGRERSYSIAAEHGQADLVLVDLDDSPFFDRARHLSSEIPHLPVVTAGKSDTPEGSPYHIKGMLLATRVIRVLDQVAIQAGGGEGLGMTEQPAGDVAMAADGAAERQAHLYTVLVVDDSELMRKSIILELKKNAVPLTVDQAESGEEALARVAERRYDFIFLDVMMPGMDGYEACGQIRKIAAMKSTPIIMLSAKTSPLDEVKGIMSGCTSYVTKPIEPDEFQNMLDRIMNWLSQYKKQS